jgi:hypothetical protein
MYSLLSLLVQVLMLYVHAVKLVLLPCALLALLLWLCSMLLTPLLLFCCGVSINDTGVFVLDIHSRWTF